jgi:hypothetical protein
MAAEMNDAIHAGDRFLDLRQIGEIGGHEIVVGGEIDGLSDIARPKLRINGAQNLAQARADVSGRAGNENLLHHSPR